MKKLSLILAAVAVISAACSKPETQNSKTHSDKFSFLQTELSVYEGEEVPIPVNYQKFDRGVYVKADYDFAGNPLQIVFKSSDEKVAGILSGGRLRAGSVGSATVSMSSSKVKVGGSLSVTVLKRKDIAADTRFTQDLSQPLTADMLYLTNGIATTIQGLDIDKKGNCYMSWETNSEMRVCALSASGTPLGSDMILPSGGHGDGFSIEYNSDEVYFWTSGTMGDHAENGGYSGGKANADDVRLICRHRFTPGATQYAEDAVECFYLNDNGCRIVDVDTEHDVMACWTWENGSDYMYVYKFSTIRNARKTTKTVTRPHNNGRTVECYDLNTITPVSRFSWKRKGVTTGETNSGAVQGLCVYDDKIYVDSGKKDDPATLISVMDFNGNILQKLLPFGVTADKQQLIKLGLSSNGNLEPEGMHIHEGKMYAGFVGDFSAAPKKRSCIIRLK